ncbi:TonB-dependent receptor [Reichenbachiella carrageenanivorans]|uniref:TonB-dependent receptor n=1 Tax=Reichenbachiella carrageenanivorans TaxID=2979869 RepID=A0ABY6CXP4_9BACT|nr:TonB-dependent receptor [Reichenbachiella carrageenanivorans]UXX78638.1 TonB-dependent receptor [Reichenbachiella carrageenanivorans]
MPDYLKHLLLLLLLSAFVKTDLQAQNTSVKGVVLDSLNQPISDVFILLLPDSASTLTNRKGEFSLKTKNNFPVKLVFSHLRYKTSVLNLDRPTDEISLILTEKTQVLSGVDILERRFEETREIGNIEIDAKNAYTMPSATGDFSKVLATLPGVTSNNELASVYSVRGGNYDENLIYVNGIKIYRPFLVSAGRQEGLGFINADMVGNVQFSAGGWQAKDGDKLSSVLNVEYEEPQRNQATINLSLLGGSLYYGGINKKGDLNYSFGVRHKNSKYLLGTLETNGNYLPKFTDFQGFISKKLSQNTKLGLLLSSAHNNYLTIPESKETEFGTIQASFRMSTAFEGREKLDYNTHQAGLVLTHSFNEDFISRLIVSGVYSQERENYEVEGGYLLCDVNRDPGSNRFNECVTVRGIGSNYTYGRNKLEAKVLTVEQKNEIYIDNDVLAFGMSWDYESLDDRLKEYAFTDSADYSHVTFAADNAIDIQSHKLSGFAQYTLNSTDSLHSLNIGTRLSYWSYSNQLLVSPRIQYAYRVGVRRSTTLRLATGLYQQHPFYRELRGRDGQINPDVKAQSSLHVVGGMDRHFMAWGRPFKFSTDLYYKYLWDVNPYDVNNIKIRYFATNQAKAYAYGADFRVNGEFIEGTESWFSLGILKTMEDLQEGNGYVRRPTDQLINLGIFFQDHLPNDPSIKVSVNMLFGSGLPFGPPGNDDLRNEFSGDEYYRLDLGFSKSFEFENDKTLSPNSLWIGLELLNALGAENTISYTWIQDVVGNQFAVPNALSARFLNLRVIAKF